MRRTTASILDSYTHIIIMYLWVSDSNENIIKELLDLLVEERRGVDGQLTENENLYIYANSQYNNIHTMLIRHKQYRDISQLNLLMIKG